MNDPVPAFGRGGWVCAALLLGLFAGGGITWATLARRAIQPPLVVYQLPAKESSAEPSPPTAGLALDPGTRGDAAAEPLALEGEDPARSLRLSELPLRNDHVLRGHPQAEGCFANALAALAAFTKQGFELRDKVWDGEISLDEGKAVSCQLFKGNDYCFCAGTDTKGAKLSLQLYDHDGLPAEAEQSVQTLPEGASATAWLRCRQTGTYIVIVKLEAAAREKVPWGMVSAYR